MKVLLKLIVVFCFLIGAVTVSAETDPRVYYDVSLGTGYPYTPNGLHLKISNRSHSIKNDSDFWNLKSVKTKTGKTQLFTYSGNFPYGPDNISDIRVFDFKGNKISSATQVVSMKSEKIGLPFTKAKKYKYTFRLSHIDDKKRVNCSLDDSKSKSYECREYNKFNCVEFEKTYKNTFSNKNEMNHCADRMSKLIKIMTAGVSEEVKSDTKNKINKSLKHAEVETISSLSNKNFINMKSDFPEAVNEFYLFCKKRGYMRNETSNTGNIESTRATGATF